MQPMNRTVINLKLNGMKRNGEERSRLPMKVVELNGATESRELRSATVEYFWRRSLFLRG